MNAILVAAKCACVAALITLAACNGPSGQTTPPNAVGIPSTRQAHANGRSWIDPAAKGKELLYVSDKTARVVNIYDASTDKLVGTLTGFLEPVGLCSDLSGNVWVVDLEEEEVSEFPHGGTNAIAGIDTGGGEPQSCSVDPSTGDLAVGVTNLGSAHGWIQICTPSLLCTNYPHSTVAYVAFVSYDKDGNLYADGRAESNGAFVMNVRSGGHFHPITIKGATINDPGGIVNSNGVLSLGDAQSTVYQLAKNGTVTGTTTLTGASQCEQFAIQGNAKAQVLTCPNLSGASVTKYKYPAGGKPTKTITGLSEPYAAVYSK
ncbi:MAG TPA: hypothetical protein VGK84_07475 [Candidatus Tumulicola sp.]